MYPNHFLMRPFRAGLYFIQLSQGVALGYTNAPFQGWIIFYSIIPGLCPGLYQYALSGLSKNAFSLTYRHGALPRNEMETPDT
jgi:hypothetical protein